MPKQLNDVDSDAAAKPVSTGGVQVKSVSATGNIKISLKPVPEAKSPNAKTELRSAQVKKQPVDAGQEPPLRAAKPAAKKKSAAKVQKPQIAATSKLASASAQGEANVPNPVASRSSLKPLGLTAAVLGTVALSLGVMQFAGGSDAQDVAVAAPVTAAPAVQTDVVTAQVDADKAAIVAPVQASVAGANGDVTAEAIAAAVAKLAPSQTLAEPAPRDDTSNDDVLEKAAFASASLFQASPKEIWEQERAEADRIEPVAVAPKTVSAPHVSTAQKLALVSYLSALPDGPEAQEQASALTQKMTSGTLAALSKPKTEAVEDEPIYIFDLVVNALAEGRTEAELDQLINETYAAGRVTVPSSLILADGRVDSQTILVLFAGK